MPDFNDSQYFNSFQNILTGSHSINIWGNVSIDSLQKEQISLSTISHKKSFFTRSCNKVKNFELNQ